MITNIHFETLTNGMKARLDPTYRQTPRGHSAASSELKVGFSRKKGEDAVFPFKRIR